MMHALILLTFLKHARGQRAHWYNWVYSVKEAGAWWNWLLNKKSIFYNLPSNPQVRWPNWIVCCSHGGRSRALVPWCRGASRLGLSFVPLTSFALSFPISPPSLILQPKSSFGQFLRQRTKSGLFWEKWSKAANFAKTTVLLQFKCAIERYYLPCLWRWNTAGNWNRLLTVNCGVSLKLKKVEGSSSRFSDYD